jgi:hypothetical protein
LIFGNPQLFIRIFVNDRKRVEIEAMRMIFWPATDELFRFLIVL